MGGGDDPPLEENAYFLEFYPNKAHLLLKGVYGDCPNNNGGYQLGGGFPDDAIFHHRWRRLTMQLSIWYVTPYESVGQQFTEILSEE